MWFVRLYKGGIEDNETKGGRMPFHMCMEMQA